VAQRDTKTRSIVWEDEAAVEPRFRRSQAGAPLSGRGLPGMPIAIDDPDDESSAGRAKPRRFTDEPRRSWWRPASTFGRVLVGTGAVSVLAVVAVSAYAVQSFLERDARFRIAGTSNIQATGLAEVSRTEMLPVFGEDVGRNIFFVPLSERRKQLEQIPWVERATVMRLLPDQIRVSVVERKPVAFMRQGAQIELVDPNGVLLTMPPAMMSHHHYSFPVVTGIDGRDPLPSRKSRMAMYQRLIGELDSNNQHLSDQISEIDLTDPEDARVLMPEQGTDILAHFGEDHFLERYKRYKAHIAEWRQLYPKLAEVDLRYDQQVVLQMTGGANAAPATLKADAAKPDAAETAKPVVVAKSAPAKHALSAKTVKSHPTAKTTKPKTTKGKASTKPVQKKKPTPANRTVLNQTKPHSTTNSPSTGVARQGQ
jgi:cell division protein FtsQ